MAKGQKRSNREVKKPKTKKVAPTNTVTSGIMTKGTTNTPKKK